MIKMLLVSSQTIWVDKKKKRKENAELMETDLSDWRKIKTRQSQGRSPKDEREGRKL